MLVPEELPPSPSNGNATQSLSSSQKTEEPRPVTESGTPSLVPPTKITRKTNPIPKEKPKASLTPDQWLLVEDIETACRDFHSRGHFINLVRRYNEESIHTALSITKEKLSLESGVNAGAYFYRISSVLDGGHR